jgi:hypothetical protein
MVPVNSNTRPNGHINGPEMSDISDEEDDMALLQRGALETSMDKNKRIRIFWSSEKEDYLLRVYNYYRRTFSGTINVMTMTPMSYLYLII